MPHTNVGGESIRSSSRRRRPQSKKHLKAHIFPAGDCSWGSPGDGQYHIQTDEGPERYFRFQTNNGQFRKEKRLRDGTVIGTEAWIDATGIMRQKDYIADKDGYRILKSKTVFVGHDIPIEDAIKATKSAPPQSGLLVQSPVARKNSINFSSNLKHAAVYSYSTTPAPVPVPAPAVARTFTTKLNYLPPAEVAKIEPSPYLGFDHYPDELARTPQKEEYQQQPILVQIRSHAEPIEDEDSNSISDDNQYTTTPAPLLPPSLEIEPPLRSTHRRVRPIAVLPTRPVPITAATAAREDTYSHSYSTPGPFSTSYVKGYDYRPSSTPAFIDRNYEIDAYSTTARPVPAQPLDVNSLEDGLLPPLATKQHRRLRPQPFVQSNQLGTDGGYDGVGSTRFGYRYILPNQYHEEEQIDEHKRAGSYGYVDPFGIRRVVYYNSSPERGFVHRNNNRYVGHGAAPYDPVVT